LCRNGIVLEGDSSTFTSYSQMGDGDAATQCLRGGRALLALELITMIPLLLALPLCTIRLIGVHVSRLQPPSRWLHVELWASVVAALMQLVSCVAWGVSCYHASTAMVIFKEMTPTGFVWLAICFGALAANAALYWIIRNDPQQCMLGSVYGSELTEGHDAIAEQNYLEEPTRSASAAGATRGLPAAAFGGEI